MMYPFFALFKKRRDEIAEQMAEAVSRMVDTHLKGIQEDIKVLGTVAALEREKKKLKEDLETLKIESDRFKETQERLLRETEHKVGLVKIQHEQEISFAKREVALEVKEKTLDADRKRFEEQMKFERQQFEGQIAGLRDMIDPLLKALPKAEILMNIEREEKR